MSDKLTDNIGFDFKDKGTYVIGSHDYAGNKVEGSTFNDQKADELLSDLALHGTKEDRELLASQIVEPIAQVVPYMEQYSQFFMDVTYDDREDNTIPVEDTQVMAYETHQDGEILYTRPGFSFTRPDFVTWDTGIEIGWKQMGRAGWNILGRQMKRATEALARKRDELAGNVLRAAIPADHEYNVTGGALTKVGVDTVLKAQAAIGFPVQKALCNPSTLMAMSNFTWGATASFVVPPEDARSLMRTLVVSEYGGVQWYTNPFFSTTEVLFAGAPENLGWHQMRGSVTTSSDVNITKGVDLHAIRDAEHAYYVGNAYTLARIRIGA